MGAVRVRGKQPRRQKIWRRWYCQSCGVPVRYGQTYCSQCEDEVFIDEEILAPQILETVCKRRTVGEPRLRDARPGRLRGEE